MKRNLVLDFLRYFLPPVASNRRLICQGQNSHSLYHPCSLPPLLLNLLLFFLFLCSLLFLVFVCLLLWLLHVRLPLHRHCRLLLLDALVVIIAVNLPILRPFCSITSWLTYSPSCVRIPPNLSRHCPNERLTCIHGLSSSCGRGIPSAANGR